MSRAGGVSIGISADTSEAKSDVAAFLAEIQSKPVTIPITFANPSGNPNAPTTASAAASGASAASGGSTPLSFDVTGLKRQIDEVRAYAVQQFAGIPIGQTASSSSAAVAASTEARERTEAAPIATAVAEAETLARPRYRQSFPPSLRPGAATAEEDPSIVEGAIAQTVAKAASNRVQDRDDRRSAPKIDRAASARGPQGPQAEPEEEDAAEPQGRQRDQFGRFRRQATIGFAAYEALRVLQTQNQENQALGLATSPEDRLRAYQATIRSVASIPIVGQALDLVTGNQQYGIARTAAEAEQQDQETAFRRGDLQQSQELQLRAGVASSPAGSQRQFAQAESQLTTSRISIRERSRVRSEEASKANELAISGIEEQYRQDSSYFPNILFLAQNSADKKRAAALGTQSGVNRRSRESAARQERGDTSAAESIAESERRDIQLSLDTQDNQFAGQLESAQARTGQYTQAQQRQAFDSETGRDAQRIRREQSDRNASDYVLARNAERDRVAYEQGRSAQEQRLSLGGSTQSALYRAANNPLAAQLNDIYTQGGLSALRDSNDQNTVQIRNPITGQTQRINPLIAANTAAQALAAVATQYRQFTAQQQGQNFQIQAADYTLNRQPLRATVSGLQAERANQELQIAALPAYEQVAARRNADNLLNRRTRVAIQQRDDEISQQRLSIRSETESLAIRNSPNVDFATASTQGDVNDIYRRSLLEIRASRKSGDSLEPDLRARGLGRLDAYRRQFLQGFRAEGVDDINSVALSGPSTINTATALGDFAKDRQNIANGNLDFSKLGPGADAGDPNSAAALQQIQPDVKSISGLLPMLIQAIQNFISSAG